MKLIFMLFLSLSLYASSFIHSNVLIEALFPDGESRTGMGVIFDKNGAILTSSKIIYNNIQDYSAQDITIKIQDIREQPLVCFAKVKVKAIDTDKNLAILIPYRNSDIFCNTIISKSIYHEEYYKKNSEDIFGLNRKVGSSLYPKKGENLKYLIYNDDFMFQSAKTKALELITKEQNDRRIVSFAKVDSKIASSSIGAGVYNESEEFMGILDIELNTKDKEAKVITKNIVTGWFCELANKEILDLLVESSSETYALSSTKLCKNLGYEYSHPSKNWHY